MDKYLGGEDLTEEEITAGIKKRCLAMEVTPMVCGTSFKNKGIQPLLDAVAMYYHLQLKLLISKVRLKMVKL